MFEDTEGVTRSHKEGVTRSHKSKDRQHNNATFSNISAISWRPVSVVEEAGVLGENHRKWATNWSW
jgi:hypothetical protein